MKSFLIIVLWFGWDRSNWLVDAAVPASKMRHKLSI